MALDTERCPVNSVNNERPSGLSILNTETWPRPSKTLKYVRHIVRSPPCAFGSFRPLPDRFGTAPPSALASAACVAVDADDEHDLPTAPSSTPQHIYVAVIVSISATQSRASFSLIMSLHTAFQCQYSLSWGSLFKGVGACVVKITC